MSKSKIIKHIMLGVCAAVVIGANIISVPKAFADSSNKRIQISGVKEYPQLKPGDNYRSSIKIENIGTERFKYKVSSNPYSVKGESYDQDYMQENSYNQISKWVKFEWDTAELDPGKSIEVPYVIHVPQDVPAGGQYVAITAEVVQDNQDNKSVGISGQYRVAKIIYASIDGETRATGEFIKNDIGGVFFSAPITATSLVKNTGNIHSDLTTILEVTSIFNDKDEIYSNANNPNKVILLPDTTRYNTVQWDEPPMVGLFKVKQTLQFQDKTSVSEKIVLICPLWLMILIVIAIVSLVLWIVFRCRDRKKSNKNNHKKGE